jgi:hypothetical protein
MAGDDETGKFFMADFPVNSGLFYFLCTCGYIFKKIKPVNFNALPCRKVFPG